MNHSTNVADLQLATGYSQFHAFCAEAEVKDLTGTQELLCEPAQVSDEEEPMERGEDRSNPWWDHNEKQQEDIIDGDGWTDKQLPMTVEFDEPQTQQQLPSVIEDEEDTQPVNTAAEFLKYHHKFGHCSPRRIQQMARDGILPRRLATCDVPVCTACLYGKATRRPWRSKLSKNHTVREVQKPGQVVSVDQMISPTPGLVAQMSGRPTTKRYRCATIFVDQATGLGYVHLQQSTKAEETLEGKIAFERYAAQFGVRILAYHADNGVFAARAWKDKCNSDGQRLTFAGVGAHHQNGIAERRIKELQHMARTMLIHANRRWTNAITANLWPYAVKMASESLNHTPNLQLDSRQSAMEAFSGTQVTINPKHWQHFGCPIYVADRQIQDQKPIHKWADRSRVGIYLGTSPLHARNVALVLSLQSGLVSPQFHVRFDPKFQTLRKSFGEKQPASEWQIKCGFIAKKSTKKEVKMDIPTPPIRDLLPDHESSQQPIPPAAQTADHTDDEFAQIPDIEQDGDIHDQEEQQEEEREVTLRRSQRQRQPRSILTYDETGQQTDLVVQQLLSQEIQNRTEGHSIPNEIFCMTTMFPEDNVQGIKHPVMAYAASSNPDVMYLHEAMKQPDKKQFVEAMLKEVQGQLNGGHYVIVHKSQVPEGAQVFPSVWALRRKRKINTNEVYKWKARLNFDGSKQIKGQHYDESYAPVATWGSVRLLLALTLINNWCTQQIDFVQAYPQAPIEREVYMKIPKGFEIVNGNPNEYVLKLRKNVYGQVQAGRVWNKYLVNKLMGIGFKQSKADECVFYRGRALYVLYTDDSILAAPTRKEIDDILLDMHNAKLDITEEGEGNIADFLGVNIDRKENGSFVLTQPHLISSILEDLGLKDGDRVQKTPISSSKILSRHPNSMSFDNSFHYRSVIGKLNYLERGSRPDISYAVHQCARFVEDPKIEHGKAVRWLGRYLLGTRDKGVVFKPNDQSFQVYADADYAGNWDKEIAQNDVDTARSRSGYIVMYAGCPIMWASNLQTQIALSSTESEFICLSNTLRVVIPTMELLKELKHVGFGIQGTVPEVHCKVFEDNSGAIEIAKVPKMRPRTKHINIRYHHFRHHVEKGEVTIHAIDTSDQPADMLNKPLSEVSLRKHRLFIQGWDT